MTRLQCSAVHCEYNDDNHCCLPGVKIGGGDNARTSRDTCCDSFRERSNQSSNHAVFNRPDDKLNVACSACKCKYNHAGACAADSVKIGNAASYRHQDTECHTFCKSKTCC